MIRKARESQKVDSEIGGKLLKLFFDPAFSVIEILPGSFIESHEITTEDRFSDEMHGSNLQPKMAVPLQLP